MAANSSLQLYLDCIPEKKRNRLNLKLDSGHGGVQKDLGVIGDAMDEWEGRVATELGLTKPDIASIKTEHRDNLQLQTRAALQKWTEKYGINATYKNLMVAFLKAGKPDYVETVCKILGGTPENIRGTSFQATPPATSHTITSPQSSSHHLRHHYSPSTRLNTRDHYHSLLSFLSPFAANWRDIGEALGFFRNELNIIQSNPMLLMQGPSGYLGDMLTKWLQWAPGDGRGSKNFATFEDLRDALLQMNLGVTATELQAALGVQQDYHQSGQERSAKAVHRAYPKVCKADALLTLRDHYEITKVIHDVPNNDIISLGEHFGLSRPKLLRMRDLPGDMVAAWLRQEDHVIAKGATPTWRTLANGLVAVNQCGLAEKIKINVGIETCSEKKQQQLQPSSTSISSSPGNAHKKSPVSKSLSTVSTSSAEGKDDDDGFTKMLVALGVGLKDRKILRENEINEAALKCLEHGDLQHMSLSLGGRKILERYLDKMKDEGCHRDRETRTTPPSTSAVLRGEGKGSSSNNPRSNVKMKEFIDAPTASVLPDDPASCAALPTKHDTKIRTGGVSDEKELFQKQLNSVNNASTATSRLPQPEDVAALPEDDDSSCEMGEASSDSEDEDDLNGDHKVIGPNFDCESKQSIASQDDINVKSRTGGGWLSGIIY